MHEYEDVERHVTRHIAQAAEQYTVGLQKTGLRPSARLERALAERASHTARERYIQEATAIRDSNISVIQRDHTAHMQQINRASARLRIAVYPPIILLFSLIAWYNFTFANNAIMGACFVAGSLVLLALLLVPLVARGYTKGK